MDNKRRIRKTMTAQRINMPASDRERLSSQACEHVINSADFQRANHVALYMSHNGEVDPQAILNTAHKAKKTCYLPVLNPTDSNHLMFVRFDQGDLLVKNRYNIPEPILTAQKIVGLRSIQLVIMPLVAFDNSGQRLGMGAGYYDRSLSYLKNNPPTKPTLLGLGYEFQRVAQLPFDEWDIPLDLMVTEKSLSRPVQR